MAGQVPWRTEDIVAAGTRYHVRLLGDRGDLALLLHGWPQSGSMWRLLAPRLVDMGFRVAAPDLKGFGRSDAPRNGYDQETLSTEVLGLIEALRGDEAVIVGHDWGAFIGVTTALRHPQHVRALVAASAPLRSIEPWRFWYAALLNVPVLPQVGAKLVSERFLRYVFRYATTDASAFTDEVIAEYAEAIRVNPSGWLGYYRQMGRNVALRQVRRMLGRGGSTDDISRRPATSVLLVHGDSDPISSPAGRAADAEWLGADLVVIPDAGHFVPEEQPELFNAAVERFLEHART